MKAVRFHREIVRFFEEPTPFHLPGERMAAKKKAKKSAKKAAKRPAKRPAKKAAKKKTKRTPNAAFMRPMQPDAALAAVVGSNGIPRTEITKKLWQYIKRNGLQDAKERRMINADDKLKAVFNGKKQVSMFEMTKLVNKHMK
jgi:upstream activation factor subunit UAF30